MRVSCARGVSGGAERLVVDAALALQKKGFEVIIYTSHHDRAHCFEETRDGTLKVRVRGDFWPRHLFGKFHIVFAILRNLWAAGTILAEREPYDICFVDQISMSIPLLALRQGQVLFYCHHPDLLLTKRESLLKRLYRAPVDLLEELTTGLADRVLVNSRYTGDMYRATFKHLAASQPPPEVLYPSINFEKYDRPLPPGAARPADGRVVFLSINRFERKKNIGLAIRALAVLRRDSTRRSGAALQLVVAGGYDERVAENVEHYRELKEVAAQSGLSTSDFPDRRGEVVFLRSFSEEQRTALLHECSCVVYTPANEHFGIVPVEAMYAKRPVLAVNSGGPLESVVDGVTGFLRPGEPEPFAQAMALVADGGEALVARMGDAGREHVLRNFSFASFADRLSGVVGRMLQNEADARAWRRRYRAVFAAFVCAALILVVALLANARPLRRGRL
jgi:alpha-1,3/alpha-1,6-mannosyltransferase